jgi:uncharacterized protein YndB with AHSA1/START domain
MAKPCRGHVVIEAPVDDVWAVVSNPRTHPDWWPDVHNVRVDGEVSEGGEYTRVDPTIAFLKMADAVWVAERLEHLKEAHFRCTVTGTYARFALTPAQDDTFVEIETGMLPPSFRWRAAKAVSTPHLKRWMRDVIDELPRVVARHRTAGPVL